MDSFGEQLSAAAGSAWTRGLVQIKQRARSGLPSTQFIGFARFVVFAVVLPSAFVFALVLAAGWKAGTVTSPWTLSRSQQRNPKLILFPTGGALQYAAYKLARIEALQPDIIYVGQSRCAETRSAMFAPYKFYNACLTAWTLDQIRDFIEHAALVARPSTVIIELDYFMFTKEYMAAWTAKATQDFAPNSLAISVATTLNLAKEQPRYFLQALKPSLEIPTEPHTGFQLRGPDAIRSGAGFRYDGSLLYPFSYRAVGAKLLNDAAHDFLSAVHGGPGLDPGQVEALSRLADTASKLGVKLVGIQLPVFAPVIDYLDTDPAYHPYAGLWRAFESEETRQMFARLGITFFDMIRLPENGEAGHFLDPAHPSEIGILCGLVAMSSEPGFKSRFPLIDPERLRSDYEAANASGRNYDVYVDHF